MFSFTPSLNPQECEENLGIIMKQALQPSMFSNRISRLQRLFDCYLRNCPPPWPAPGHPLDSELFYKSELWLPLSEIRPHFEAFYRSALAYPPLYGCSPFAESGCWFSLVGSLRETFPQLPLNPASLLTALLENRSFRVAFLFRSFMPKRFYGSGTNRYPFQSAFLRDNITTLHHAGRRLRCLDAACGDGAATYDLSGILLQSGLTPEEFQVEGWTMEPLEAFAAAHAFFPHAPLHQQIFRQAVQPVFGRTGQASITFMSRDILVPETGEEPFNLIICNGLLGGPIINQPLQLEQVTKNLTSLLTPGGLLLAADHFHGGWKQRCPRENLRALFCKYGLTVEDAGEGIAGRKRP